MKKKTCCTFNKAIEHLYEKEGNIIIVETKTDDKYAYTLLNGHIVVRSDINNKFLPMLVITKSTIEGNWFKVEEE